MPKHHLKRTWKPVVVTEWEHYRINKMFRAHPEFLKGLAEIQKAIAPFAWEHLACGNGKTCEHLQVLDWNAKGDLPVMLKCPCGATALLH